jgi:hypothetical protein
MKIFDVSRFTGKTLEDVIDFLTEELRNCLQNVMIAFRSLSFHDNFRTFSWEGTIAAGQTVTITNTLRTAPAYRILTRSVPTGAGTVIIDDSTTPWTSDLVYLRNSGSVSARIKVVFFEN